MSLKERIALLSCRRLVDGIERQGDLDQLLGGAYAGANVAPLVPSGQPHDGASARASSSGRS